MNLANHDLPITPLVDIGANLAHDSFDRDRAEVIARAVQAGVSRIIVTGSTVASSRAAVDLARRYQHRLFATIGVHPHHAAEFGPDTAPQLVEMATCEGVVAVGECGLDYFRNYSPRPAQLRAFERQLSLASATGKPVFLHQREAHQDFMAVLRERIGELTGGVAHCFTGTRDQMEAYLDLGLFIGITGWICDERRAQDLREAVARLPLDRVMLETDAPYLLPRSLAAKPASGRRNEPAYLPEVLRMTASFMRHSVQDVALATTRNAQRLFGLPQSGGDSVPG